LNTKSNTDPNPKPSTNSLFPGLLLLLAVFTFSKQTASVNEKLHQLEKQLKTSNNNNNNNNNNTKFI